MSPIPNNYLPLIVSYTDEGGRDYSFSEYLFNCLIYWPTVLEARHIGSYCKYEVPQVYGLQSGIIRLFSSGRWNMGNTTRTHTG
jgi:hypothetical protein